MFVTTRRFWQTTSFFPLEAINTKVRIGANYSPFYESKCDIIWKQKLWGCCSSFSSRQLHESNLTLVVSTWMFIVYVISKEQEIWNSSFQRDTNFTTSIVMFPDSQESPQTQGTSSQNSCSKKVPSSGPSSQQVHFKAPTQLHASNSWHKIKQTCKSCFTTFTRKEWMTWTALQTSLRITSSSCHPTSLTTEPARGTSFSHLCLHFHWDFGFVFSWPRFF